MGLCCKCLPDTILQDNHQGPNCYPRLSSLTISSWCRLGSFRRGQVSEENFNTKISVGGHTDSFEKRSFGASTEWERLARLSGTVQGDPLEDNGNESNGWFIGLLSVPAIREYFANCAHNPWWTWICSIFDKEQEYHFPFSQIVMDQKLQHF